MKDMTSPMDIGLPHLSEEDIENLAEACEEQVTEYILKTLPVKSIEELSVVCTLEFDKVLEVSIDVEVIQKYETEHDLEQITEDAVEYCSAWLEDKLAEMKSD